ncbi:MAG TPA: pyridoxal 5'-phosphate synthase glutaminase subunit PdxT [Alkalispirochaeta sp.]|nr:pyridoxal 5'-phosphate synthase glutaminase subunit PdxT [Alkalispirochaeta sp.]
MLTVGVIAFQGDFSKHISVFRELGADPRPVRRPDELVGLDGLVIPGGESTTIGMLMQRFGVLDAVRAAHAARTLPIMGTCAGAILLAQRITGSDQVRLGLIDMEIERNAYGRQVDSFEASLMVPALGTEPVTGVFIRAPRISTVGPTVSVLARFEESPVVIQAGSLLALSFHPELTGDYRIHDHFLHMIRGDR